FLTEPGDLIVDPFGGSNMTGAMAEELGRRWSISELRREYLDGSLGRFAGAKGLRLLSGAGPSTALPTKDSAKPGGRRSSRAFDDSTPRQGVLFGSDVPHWTAQPASNVRLRARA